MIVESERAGAVAQWGTVEAKDAEIAMVAGSGTHLSAGWRSRRRGWRDDDQVLVRRVNNVRGDGERGGGRRQSARAAGGEEPARERRSWRRMADMIVISVRCVEEVELLTRTPIGSTLPQLAAEALCSTALAGTPGESTSSVPVGGLNGRRARRSRRPETPVFGRVRASRKTGSSNGFSDQRMVDDLIERSSSAVAPVRIGPRSGRTRTPTFLAARNNGGH